MIVSGIIRVKGRMMVMVGMVVGVEVMFFGKLSKC